MNEVELLALGEVLARTTDTLRPGEYLPFHDYAVFVDGRPVDGPESTLPVTAASRVVLYRRQGPALDVLTPGSGGSA
jgi:hypothetical protein